MKRLMSYMSAAAVLVLFCVAPAFAVVDVPEPGTMAIIGGVAVGGFIARKILKRK
jgi:hypothetical protein